MKTLKERIAVEQAYEDGINIEYEPSNKGYAWQDLTTPKNVMVFYWQVTNYRIKPKPMEFWINIYEKAPLKIYYDTEDEAKNAGEWFSDYIKTIKVREVIE